jgi:hypothetical protein
VCLCVCTSGLHKDRGKRQKANTVYRNVKYFLQFDCVLCDVTARELQFSRVLRDVSYLQVADVRHLLEVRDATEKRTPNVSIMWVAFLLRSAGVKSQPPK